MEYYRLPEAGDQPGIGKQACYVRGEECARQELRLSCPTPKVPITFGIATLTIELAKTMTKNASNAAVVTSQRYIGP